MSKYKKIDISRVRTGPIDARPSKIDPSMLARPVKAGAAFADFWDSLPHILKAEDLRTLVSSIVAAKRKNKPVLIMMGAHVIKTGLNPVLIDMMESGIVQGLAMNGAGAIHDTELAYFGKTSEDVAASLKTGEFGMARETGELLNETLLARREEAMGFGEALGRRIVEDGPVFIGNSLLGQAYQLDIPVTVHVAIGTDIVHQHPNADGAMIGEASLHDFHVFCQLVSQINDGGVVLLFGSAVILPEVFLKALTVARNIHGDIDGFTTASFDMMHHYRPRVNVIERPTLGRGKGFGFTGHHELMIPLLAAAVRHELAAH